MQANNREVEEDDRCKKIQSLQHNSTVGAINKAEK